MRHIPLPEAEKQLRTLVGQVRAGARLRIVDQGIAQADLLPPPRRDDARDLDLMVLKRHVSRLTPAAQPVTWRRAALYAGRKGGSKP